MNAATSIGKGRDTRWLNRHSFVSGSKLKASPNDPSKTGPKHAKAKAIEQAGAAGAVTNSPPRHMSWLSETDKTLHTADGRPVKILQLNHDGNDEILSDWARHFRNQYCDDGQIDALREGTPQSRTEYLRSIKFPDEKEAPGPSIRSGDFGEILVADYLEYMLGYWVPRIRYDDKAVRNESTKGTDIIGFMVLDDDDEDLSDTLAIFEAKAQFSGTISDGRLQAAIDGSAKDEYRKAMSLNALKQRFLNTGDLKSAGRIERFQNPEDRPHKELYGAAALVSTHLFKETDIKAATADGHWHADELSMIVIHGQEMMNLVHELYERAADEA